MGPKDTGQYSNTADFGLMFYNARWYDPGLSRFTSADTIIPAGVQGLDRFDYVRGNPIRYNDPSGHCVELDEGTCLTRSGGILFGADTDRSSWERRSLRRLYEKGGPHAVDGVLFILENDVRLRIGSLPFGLDKDRGAWFDAHNKTITLNEDSYSYLGTPDAYGLSLIIHEAKHLEQGTELSHSRLGEMEGWQAQFDVLSHFQRLSAQQEAVLRAQTLDQFEAQIKENWPSYWFNGTWGLYTYPSYPDWYWYGGSMYSGGKPWWLRINLR